MFCHYGIDGQSYDVRHHQMVPRIVVNGQVIVLRPTVMGEAESIGKQKPISRQQ